MVDDLIRTGVDDLLDYLKDKDKVAMQDVVTVLGVPVDTVQAWVDFLVEEKILGIEYKFTKPYIYINKKQEETKRHGRIIENTTVDISSIKEEYFQRAKQKQIPEKKIEELWKQHVKDALEDKYEYFIEQASRRRAANITQLWQEYKTRLLTRC